MFVGRESMTQPVVRQKGQFIFTGWLTLKLIAFAVILLPLATWLPAAAQSGEPAPSDATTAPDTVVLPPVQMHIPMVFGQSKTVMPCPETSTNAYGTVSILGRPRNPNPVPTFDPDLNLQVRGYQRTTGLLELIAIHGPTDDDAPQLASLFRPARVPRLLALYQVRDWDWACCPGGRLGQPIEQPEVTLVEMETAPGELIYPPRRNMPIHAPFVAMVLYAETYRITFTYTRDDSPAVGYVVHLEDFCVDPTLLALYEQMHREGRYHLPALRLSDPIGTAHSNSILVAVRDTGSFMDPRSGKDWWQEVVRARLAAESAAPAGEPTP